MMLRKFAAPGIGPGPALLLAALLSGCGGAAPGEEGKEAAAPSREAAAVQAEALSPVERPVARPMDRGVAAQEDTAAVVSPVERPVARPVDRAVAGPDQDS